MNDDDLRRECRKQNRLETLGTNEPICGTCGECDWRVIELHHIADHGRDDATVLVCRNCHRKLSDDQKDHARANPNTDAVLEKVGHFLIGLADLLLIVISKLQEFGSALIARAETEGAA